MLTHTFFAFYQSKMSQEELTQTKHYPRIYKLDQDICQELVTECQYEHCQRSQMKSLKMSQLA